MAVQLIKRAELEVVDPASVKLRGYAGVFNNVFTYVDPFGFTHKMRILPGAFAGVLSRMSEPMPLVWYHQSERVQFGETTELTEDRIGLRFEGVPFATTEAVDLITAMHGKESRRFGASFAFDWGEVAEPDDDGIEDIRTFSAVHELGPAPRGVNPLAFAELVPRDAEALAIDDETEEPAEPAAIEPADEEQAALAAEWYRAAALLRSDS